MPEADITYADVKFTRPRPRENVASNDITYSEVRISNKQQPAINQTSGSIRRSKVSSEQLVLLVLLSLLVAAVIALGVTWSFMNQRIQTLTEENGALRRNLSAKMNPKCEADWMAHGGSLYKFNTMKSSWTESRYSCIAQGGDLVKIDSREEQFLDPGLFQQTEVMFQRRQQQQQQGHLAWQTQVPPLENHQQLNTSETEELVIDFRKSGPFPVLMEAEEVVLVEKYPRLSLDNKLDWACNTSDLYKSSFLQRLRSLNIFRKLLQMFCQPVVGDGEQQKAEAAASQHENPTRTSKLPSERVVMLVLGSLLAAALVIIYRLFFDKIQTNQMIQTLKEENEALRRNFSEEMRLNNRPEWERYQGKCYKFNTRKSSWTESRDSCRRLGGDLVKIDNRDEQVFLEIRLRDWMEESEDKFWIGLTDSKKEGRWLWADGSPLNESLTFWSKGQPNDGNKRNPAGEDCVRMWLRGGAGDLKRWFDMSCGAHYKSICEKSIVPGLRPSVCK
ncbi:uncharacterized protein LOC119790490 [Cyprinodon tularosa]|uniref:uncharacterized protein LOC119790490 n=1 Tax=Cyprinodon tularosa TaxID=77115 RepID=UPI0018E21143|nr:uncharacterized protein LOC119790490 [Cyprinodon tularosa]